MPWAIYLMKTGDLAFVKQNFDSEGPLGAAQPSIEDTAHAIAAGRTSPTGIMAATDDIDTQGYWTTDDYSALIGLAAYRYLAQRVGDASEAAWATEQYASLLSATNKTLDATIARYHLDYVPCSILRPNTANRCKDPKDANWMSPLGAWAWDASLFGATVNGPGATMIDATYDYGFARLKGKLPPNTFGGFPGDYYSTGLQRRLRDGWPRQPAPPGPGDLELRVHDRQQPERPILMVGELICSLDPKPVARTAPGDRAGRLPPRLGNVAGQRRASGLAGGRAHRRRPRRGPGGPPQWLGDDRSISVTNFPTTDGRRLSLRISSSGRSVSLTLRGQPPSGPVLFQLPQFIDNIATTSAGRIDQGTGTVTLSPATRSVTVQLRAAPGG